MDMKVYQEKMIQLDEKIDTAIEICEKYNDVEHIEKLQKLKVSIKEDNFQLIVVGEFSVGKSTLVNALIGDNILPSDPNPTTMMLNVIKNGEKEPRYKILYKDGNETIVNKEEFERMVAQNESDKKTKNEIIQDYYEEEKRKFSIKNAEILIKNDFGKMGIDIVDTPGMNDINTAREEITLTYIPKSDAAIIVSSVTLPLPKSEMDFIKTQLLGHQITKLFVAANFADTLRAESDRKAMFERYSNELEGIVPPERIFLVSARKALKYKRQLAGETFKKPIKTYEESGFAEFEKGVLDYLANDRGSIKLQRYSSWYVTILNEIVESTLEHRKQAIFLSKEALEEEVAKLIKNVTVLEKQYYRELEKAANELIAKKTIFSKQYEKKLKQMGEAALDEVKNYYGLDMEELHSIISNKILSHKQKLKKDFLSYISKEIEKTIHEHIDVLGEEFKAIGITRGSVRFLDLNMSEDMTIYSDEQVLGLMSDKNDKSSEGGLGEILIGAAIGVGIAAVIANPVLLIGAAAIGKFLAANSSDSKDNQSTELQVVNEQPVVTNAMIKNVYNMEVRKCYVSNIPDKVNEFKREYEKNIYCIIESLKEDCNTQLENIKRQYQSEMDEKSDEKSKIENRMNCIREDINKIIDLKLWCGGAL